MSDYGGIYRFPVTQVTGSILINRRKLMQQIPDLDARITKIRLYALGEMDKTIAFIDTQEKAIPEKYWLDLAKAEKIRYLTMMKEARERLTKEGFYDPQMMSLMKKIRCKHQPQNAECGV
ncbi:MAG: hypothetical protein IPM78_06055 [Moraxellaceae bacterium]|nr:hypothetical protein [Moraxellaceae bacterium]